MSYHIDKEAFFRRLGKFYTVWEKARSNKEDDLGKVDALVVAVGADQEVIYSKSTATQIWLFGYELTEFIMVCTEQAVYFLASKKKIQILEVLDKHKDENSNVPPIKLLIRDKNDKDKINLKKLIEAIKKSINGSAIGFYKKDRFSSELVDSWRKHLKDGNFEQLDVSNQMALVMSVKDDSELSTIKRASNGTVDVFTKYLKEQIMDIIDKDKKVKHTKLSEGVEQAMSDKKYISGLDTQLIEPCYPPIFQSGGNYALKFSINSDKNALHFGAIICCMGLRYKSYCSNVCRTFMVNPTDTMQKNYEFLLEVYDKVINRLQTGVKLCDVYSDATSFIKSKRPDLIEKFTKSVGFATGIEFRESSMVIGSQTTIPARKGQVYNLSLGFSNLSNSDAKDKEGKTYAFFLGDTVVVNENQSASILTAASKKKLKSVAIFLKEEDSSSEGDEDVDEENPEILGRGKRSAILDSKLRQESSSEEKRREHQKELAAAVNAAAKDRLTKMKGAKSDSKIRKSNISYKSVNLLPKEFQINEMKLFVDRKYESVIFPVSGTPTPYHISMIKNISASVEGAYTYLRINFFHPGSNIGKGEYTFTTPEALFVKEVTFRSTNKKEPGELTCPSTNLNTAYRLIKEVQKKFKTREAEEKEREDLVKQDTLIISSLKSNPKLKDLYIRPNLLQKRINGSLEAHSNGFRFTSVRGDKIDILYNNIKHAFFQPPEKEMIILLHFHLRHAVLFGKRKHNDVQFYTEVGEITTDLGKHQHMHDRDDLSAEQAERELRHKLTVAFKSFTEKVENLTKNQVDFDTPFRELGFAGAPFRSTVLLQPTSSCLVNLTEWPPFVIVLDEVELIHFERVQFHLKNFDMVFIFKDYHRKTAMINAIPMNLLDDVKQWLHNCDIRYSEGIQSINWGKLMKTIVDDPEDFFDQGGWAFLDPDSDDERGARDEDSEDDGAYAPSDQELGSVEEESDEDYSSDASEDSEDVDSEDELGSSEESGKDWSDLEREAAEADNERDTFVPTDFSRPKTHKGDKFSKSKSKSPHKSSHRSPHKSSHKSPNKNSHRSPHKSSHKPGHKDKHTSSHKRHRDESNNRNHSSKKRK